MNKLHGFKLDSGFDKESFIVVDNDNIYNATMESLFNDCNNDMNYYEVFRDKESLIEYIYDDYEDKILISNLRGQEKEVSECLKAISDEPVVYIYKDFEGEISPLSSAKKPDEFVGSVFSGEIYSFEEFANLRLKNYAKFCLIRDAITFTDHDLYIDIGSFLAGGHKKNDGICTIMDGINITKNTTDDEIKKFAKIIDKSDLYNGSEKNYLHLIYEIENHLQYVRDGLIDDEI